jgi:hypothetical protein
MCGLQLREVKFAAGMALFGFGERRPVQSRAGHEISAHECALHVTCGWRIKRDDALLVGSDDIHHRAGDEPDYEGLNPDDTIRDWRVGVLIGGKLPALTVQDVLLEAPAGMRVLFDENVTLEVIPLESTKAESKELWRLFRPGHPTHVVATARGFEM